MPRSDALERQARQRASNTTARRALAFWNALCSFLVSFSQDAPTPLHSQPRKLGTLPRHELALIGPT